MRILNFMESRSRIRNNWSHIHTTLPAPTSSAYFLQYGTHGTWIVFHLTDVVLPAGVEPVPL